MKNTENTSSAQAPRHRHGQGGQRPYYARRIAGRGPGKDKSGKDKRPTLHIPFFYDPIFNG